jgi:hypothetical protein
VAALAMTRELAGCFLFTFYVENPVDRARSAVLIRMERCQALVLWLSANGQLNFIGKASRSPACRWRRWRRLFPRSTGKKS